MHQSTINMQLVVILTALLCLKLVASNPSLSRSHGQSLKQDLIENLNNDKISISKGGKLNTVKVIEKPYLVKKPIIKKSYVDVKVPSPYPVLTRYAVPVPRGVKVPVPQGVPIPVVVPVGKAVPVRIRYPVPIFVRVPVPAPIPVPKRVPTPLPVKTPVRAPVPVITQVPVPVGVARPFVLGEESYITPGWAALGLTDDVPSEGLKTPLGRGNWQAWAKNLPLESGAVLGNIETLGKLNRIEGLQNLESVESLQSLQSLRGLKGLGNVDGIKSMDDVSWKTLGLNSGLSLDDLKGINDLDIIVDNNNLSKIRKSAKVSEVEKKKSSKKIEKSSKIEKID